MTEATLNDLAAFIDSSAGADKQRFAEALRELQTTIVGQALHTRSLTIILRNEQVNRQIIDAVLQANPLAASLQRLGRPKQTPFTAADCEAACTTLAASIAQQTDFKKILGAVVGIVKVFV
jgi:hypothetical protein